MTALSARDAYRIWAPFYSDETAISFLEDKLVSAMSPPVADARLLDAGCGTGRRLSNCAAATRVGLDASSEMLSAGDTAGGMQLIQGDVRSMPFADESFDIVWCRLVLGHLPEVDRAYAELGRVAHCGGTVVVTDFHPAAYAAGHRRSFRAGGEVVEVEHYVHQLEDHIAAANAAGLWLDEVREAEIGNDVRSFYQSAGRDRLHQAHLGLPVVFAMSFRREC